MQLSSVHRVLIVLIVGIGIATAMLFAKGFVVPGLVGCVTIAGLFFWVARTAREPRSGAPKTSPSGGPKPAVAPPDGHLRFTLVVDGLEPARVAEVWSNLCRPDKPATKEMRILFRNFTVTEGQRFRFRSGDPKATAA